jgi:hypothetical protein
LIAARPSLVVLQVYTTCQNILASPGAEALELFHVWHAAAGESGGNEQEQELVPGGAGLRVTDANKAEYVELLANHVVITLVEEQVRSLVPVSCQVNGRVPVAVSLTTILPGWC